MSAYLERIRSFNWPSVLELVGGPYCGLVVYTYNEKVTTVAISRSAAKRWQDVRWHAYSPDTIVVYGPSGACVHQQRMILGRRKWMWVKDPDAARIMADVS